MLATRIRIARAVATLCLSLLGGCSASLHEQSLFVAPGKFDFLNCADIARRQTAAAAREKELNGLMERANQDVGGPLVSAMVYAGDLAQVRAEQRLLLRTASDKKCGEPPQPPQ
jgi:hypothetical protein